MILFLMIPMYISCNLYLLIRTRAWMADCAVFLASPIFTLLYACFYAAVSFSILIAFLLPISRTQRFCKIFSNYWLGIMAGLLISVGLADLLRLLFLQLDCTPFLFTLPARLCVGGFITLFVCSLILYGHLHARRIKLQSYQVMLPAGRAAVKRLRLVLIADLHLGYNTGVRELRRMTKQINELNADCICIAGDIFDNEYDALHHPQELQTLFASLHSTYGTYGCYGNHDVDEALLGGFTIFNSIQLDDSRYEQFLKHAGIHMLHDESILIADSFYLIGRKDYSRAKRSGLGRASIEELTAPLSRDYPLICLDHQPRELLEKANAGILLDLGGHTHGGQVFPGNLFLKHTWKNAYGCKQFGPMTSIVTSGVGVWGPSLRIGTNSEIVCIDLKLK